MRFSRSRSIRLGARGAAREVGERMCGVVRDGAEVRWVEAAMLGAMMLGGVGRAD